MVVSHFQGMWVSQPFSLITGHHSLPWMVVLLDHHAQIMYPNALVYEHNLCRALKMIQLCFNDATFSLSLPIAFKSGVLNNGRFACCKVSLTNLVLLMNPFWISWSHFSFPLESTCLTVCTTSGGITSLDSNTYVCLFFEGVTKLFHDVNQFISFLEFAGTVGDCAWRLESVFGVFSSTEASNSSSNRAFSRLVIIKHMKSEGLSVRSLMPPDTTNQSIMLLMGMIDGNYWKFSFRLLYSKTFIVKFVFE